MSATETKDPLNEAALAQDTQDFATRMQKMAMGEMPPTNETVGYLLDQYKEAQAELETAQRQLSASQETLIQVRGRMAGLEKDLKHWDSVSAKQAKKA